MYSVYIVDVTLSISACHKGYKMHVVLLKNHFSLRLQYSYSTIIMEKFHLYAELYETEKRFRRSCEQIILLNNKLEDLQLRYDKARTDNHKSFRYNLRLKMATVEGVRNAFYEYACWKAEKVAELRLQVAVVSPGSETEDEDMEEI